MTQVLSCFWSWPRDLAVCWLASLGPQSRTTRISPCSLSDTPGHPNFRLMSRPFALSRSSLPRLRRRRTAVVHGYTTVWPAHENGRSLRLQKRLREDHINATATTSTLQVLSPSMETMYTPTKSTKECALVQSKAFPEGPGYGLLASSKGFAV